MTWSAFHSSQESSQQLQEQLQDLLAEKQGELKQLSVHFFTILLWNMISLLSCTGTVASSSGTFSVHLFIRLSCFALPITCITWITELPWWLSG